MRYSERYSAVLQSVDHNSRVAFSVEDKFYLIFGSCGSSGFVIFKRFLKLLVSHGSIVEVYNCLVELIRRIVRKHSLEFSESARRMVKLIGIFDYII